MFRVAVSGVGEGSAPPLPYMTPRTAREFVNDLVMMMDSQGTDFF